jgi:hypothetical protein
MPRTNTKARMALKEPIPVILLSIEPVLETNLMALKAFITPPRIAQAERIAANTP